MCIQNFHSKLKECCTSEIYQKGELYFKSDRVKNRRQKNSKIYARVRGRRNYGVTLRIDEAGKVTGYCSCPFYSENNHCKHIISVGIAYEKEEKSFVNMSAMKDKIYRQEQNLLAELMSLVVEIYPDLIDDMGLDIKEGKDFDAEIVMQNILSEADPLDGTEMDLVARRIKSVLARTEIEYERKNFNIARKIVFTIVKDCLEMDAKYDSSEIFPGGFIEYMYSHYEWMLKSTNEMNKEEILEELEILSASPYFEKEGLHKIEIA